MNFPKVAALALVGVALCAPAWANDAHRLAYSKKMGVEVLAKMAGGNWCKPELDLMVIAEEEGFFSGGKFKALMNKLGLVLAQECPTARTASIEGISDSTGQTAFKGTANSDSKWQPVEKSVVEQESTSNAQVKAIKPKDNWLSAKSLNYDDLLLRYVDDHPELLEDDKFLHTLADYFENEEYVRVLNNEFKFGPYIKGFRTRIAERVGQSFSFAKVTRTLELGTYDFEKEGFPINSEKVILAEGGLHKSLTWNGKFPDQFPFNFYIEGFPSALFLAMKPNAAERMFSQGRDGFKDRQIAAEFLFRVGKTGIYPGKDNHEIRPAFRASKVGAELIGVRFYYDQTKAQQIGQLDATSILSLVSPEKGPIVAASLPTKQKVAQKEPVAINKQGRSDSPSYLIVLGAVAAAGMGGGFLWFRRRNSRGEEARKHAEETANSDSLEAQISKEEPSLEENLLAAKNVVASLVEVMLAPGDTKECPACLSTIPRQATACKHCGKQELEDPAVALAAKSEALTDALTEKLRFYREIPVYVLSEGGWLVGQMRFENEADVFKHIDLYSDQFIKPSSFRLPSVDLILEYDKSLSKFEIKVQKPAQEVTAAPLSLGASPQISSGGQAFAHVGNSPSILPGVIGCIFAILSLFFLAIIFIPLGLLTSTIAVILGAKGKSGANIGLGIVGIIISLAAMLISPTFWIMFGVGSLM